MSKYKVLVGFLGVAILAAVLLIWNANAEADAAYAETEIALGVATEKILMSNMPQSVQAKVLTDIFVELPRKNDRAIISLSESNAASERASKSNGRGQDPDKLRGKSAEARKNVCKGLFKALDSVKANSTAKTKIQQHITDRGCTR